MRCKLCGSKLLFPDTRHENFSAGKAVAGAIAFGAVGAVAGFIGKDTKGYRCSACGMFSDAPMDTAEEYACDTAVSEAKRRGTSAAYLRCRDKYPNLEQVQLRSEAPEVEYRTEYREIPAVPNATAEEVPAAPQVKRSYAPNRFVIGCPVYPETVRILETAESNLLEMDIYNISDKALRSAYFTVTVFDDVGDEIGSIECVYQKLNAAPGEYLRSNKPFDLKTEAAYRVEIVCEKAAFTDDSVWRKSEDTQALTVADRMEITPESFKMYKYLRILLAPKSKLPEDRRIYQPVFEADYRLCICGTPLLPGCACPVCGLTEEARLEVMDYDALVNARRELIAATAKCRAESTQALYAQAREEAYRKAEVLFAKGTRAALEEALPAFRALAGYKDAEEKVAACQKRIAELLALEEAARLAKERAEEEARQEAERRRQEEQERLAQEAREKAAKRKKAGIIAAIVSGTVAALIAFLILLNTVIIPNTKYNNAIALMDAGKYSEAIAAFEALEEYKDSAQKIEECNYNKAILLMDEGNYSEAIAAFEALEEYKDSTQKIKECNYNEAILLMDEGSIVEAYEALVALDGYKDSADKAASIYVKYNVEKLKVAKVGDYVFFGTYEQDNNTSNGKEDVKWLVLEVKDGKALIVSKYALDCKPYNTSDTDVTWETCTLRKWLNNDFINAAFSTDERAVIPTVTVSADKDPKYDTNPGNATQDQVFLLSRKEVNTYFSSDSSRECEPTDYAVAQGAYTLTGNGYYWWTRSPDVEQNYAYSVSNKYWCTNPVNSTLPGVRPALWIDLNAEIS